MARKPRIRSASSPRVTVKTGRTSPRVDTRRLALEVRQEPGHDIVDVDEFDDPGRDPRS